MYHFDEDTDKKIEQKLAVTVVHLLDSLEIGGLETTVVRLATAQKQAGKNVSVITLFRNGPLLDALIKKNIKVDCLEKQSGFDLRAIMKLRSLARNCNIIHTHNAVANYYATIATLGLKIGRINTRHDMGIHLDRRRMEVLYRLSLIKTDAVALVCEAARKRYISASIVPRRLAQVVYNGIDAMPDPKKGSQNKHEIRKQLGFPTDKIIIGSIGRLNIVKDYTTLIIGFTSLRSKFPNALLIIVGDGPEKNQLQQLISSLDASNIVMLLGQRTDVDLLLRSFDVFTLTSKTEGFSIALVEASWAGLPIIATDVGGNSEIVEEGISGYLIPASSPSTVAEKLSILIQSELIRSKLGGNGRAKASKNWTTKQMMNRYNSIYSRIQKD